MDLNEQQMRAVMSNQNKILCVAGPGAGKSRVLVERVKRLIGDGSARADQIVCITFTVAASRVMQDRLPGVKLAFAGTLHSFCLKLLREHGSVLGFSSTLSVLDEEQAERLLEQCIEEVNVVTATKKQIAAAISAYPNRTKSSAFTNQTNAEIVAAKFCQTLRASNLVTFDTLLGYGLKLIEDDYECCSGYKHCLVDEAQDSSDQDLAIYESLPIPNRLFCGDFDQSVYKFRGGNVQNILAISAWPGIENITLESNYRCGASICRAAQALIEHNKDRIPKQTISATGEEGSVEVHPFAGEEQELDWLAQTIRHHGPENCAVLLRYRTGGFMERFELGLSSRGIPVARTVQPMLPQDWRKAKLLLALLNDPDNDRVAQWWVEATCGAVEATKARLGAAAARLPMNHFLKIKHDLPVVETCSRQGISHDSIERIREALLDLDPNPSIPDLLLALSAAEKESETVGTGVTVTTLHGSKGGEWPVVFLPAMEDEIMPGNKTGEDLQELRRLFFVGITRAIHTLYISHSRERMPMFAATRPKPSIPSRFIAECGL